MRVIVAVVVGGLQGIGEVASNRNSHQVREGTRGAAIDYVRVVQRRGEGFEANLLDVQFAEVREG